MYQKEKKCRILIFYHVPERELNSCLLIAESIKKLNSKAKVVVKEFYQGIYFALLYKPNVILTIPPRDTSSANRLAIVKKITNCTILSLLTEGYYQTFSDYNVQIAVGTNEYPPSLVDKYLFWGEKTRKHFVKILKENHKIEDESRSQTVGYVYYDVEAVKDFFYGEELPGEIKRWKEGFKRRILVLTGFPIAEYTKDEQIIMSAFRYYGIKGKEKEYEEELQEWKERKNDFRAYRKKYLECIVNFAKNHPDIGILIKMHPVELNDFLVGEKYQCYRELEIYSNIILLKENVLLGRIFPYTDMMVHYASTSGLEAYIYDVPTIHLYDSKYEKKAGAPGYCNYESTAEVDVNAPELFEKIAYAGIELRHLEDVENILEEQFNWEKSKKDQYHPATEYAKIILESVGVGQRLEENGFYKSVLKSVQGRDIKRYFVKGMLGAMRQGRRKEAVSYQRVLKELGVSMPECVLIEARAFGGKVKRKIKR